MASIKITLDKRNASKTKDNKHPLVLRIGHKSKTRDIPFRIHLNEKQYNHDTGKITGILNSVRHTKRTRKIYSGVDLWVDENEETIRYWEIDRLKEEIEKEFFKKSPSRTILNYGGVYLWRLKLEDRHSTAESYEHALKAFIKYRKYLKKHDFQKKISTLYREENAGLSIIEEFAQYDMEIIAIDYAFVRNFKSYMSNLYNSPNTPAIYLRSLQAIVNDAGKAFSDLRNHKPFANIKKQSTENVPEPLTLGEIDLIRELGLEFDTPIWHTRNYLLFMFNNMGMNFFDMAIIKAFQFNRDQKRIKYFRKKTHYEGDYFSILQNAETLEIIEHYLNNQTPNEYLFPIIPNDTPSSKLHRVNNSKVKMFNKYAKRIAELADIPKKITTYTIRDTWTNIGLDLGIDIRKISSGLGHSSVLVTEKHYGKSVSEKILDEINAKITRGL